MGGGGDVVYFFVEVVGVGSWRGGGVFGGGGFGVYRRVAYDAEGGIVALFRDEGRGTEGAGEGVEHAPAGDEGGGEEGGGVARHVEDLRHCGTGGEG